MGKITQREYKSESNGEVNIDEDETIDDAEYAYLKSRALLDRNMKQMIDALHTRLGSLESAAKFRMELCAEDLMPNSKKDSKQAPKITEENETQFMSRISRDIKNSNTAKETNLVSTDGVYIDPVRLLLKTKAPTETAKRLETRIEDLLSTSNREMKGKKFNKKATRSEKSKETEHKKSEEKKAKRHKLEKILTANIENYITRAITDEDLTFKAPMSTTTTILGFDFSKTEEEECKFPLTIKWGPKDVRSEHPDNAEGEMDPYIIIQYAMERISLSTGHIHMFRKLLRGNIADEFFVHLFWFIKVKFFQKGDSQNEERYLLKKISEFYVELVGMLSKMTHTQHEKDFFFRYAPYIMSNAVYYAFFYLCPGSRHMYGKGFKKTILMQIVQVLFGVQLCPISVKVTWSKLFPDDAHDDLDDGEENVQLPMPVALPGSAGPGTDIGRPKTAGSALDSPIASRAGSRRPTALSPLANKFGPGMVPDDDADEVKFSNPVLTKLPSSASLPPLDNEVGRPQSPNNKAAKNFDISGAKLRIGGHLNPQVDPLERIDMTAAPQKPKKLDEALRQKRGNLDAFYMSPVMQQYLQAPVASTRRKQTMTRTTPITWCSAGGSDTYRKAQISVVLHDELSKKARTFKKNANRRSLAAQREHLQELKQIEQNCSKIIDGGTTSVGRYSIEILKRQRAQKSVSRGGTVSDAPFVQMFSEENHAKSGSAPTGDIGMDDFYDDKDIFDDDLGI